jgi:hypothetical protein
LIQLHPIRDHFPNARIIRIIRDPRDSIRSISELPWSPKSILALAYTFWEWHREAKCFFDLDQNAYTVKYEDLVENPDYILIRLCDFLGIEYTPAMLNTSNAGKKISSELEPWKQQVSGQLDPSRLYVWKREMNSEMACAISGVMYEFISDFGYDQHPDVGQDVLPCMNMSESHISEREADLLNILNKGVVPLLASFSESLKSRSGAWLDASRLHWTTRVKKIVIMLLNLTPWYSYQQIGFVSKILIPSLRLQASLI